MMILDMFKGSGPQLLAVLTGSLNAVSDGMQFGWTAPTMKLLQSSDSPVKVTHTNEVWLELLYMVGALIGLPFSMVSIYKLGRKMTVWCGSVIGLFGWICMGAGNNVYYFYAGRILLGFTADIAFTASPVYVSEIAHQKIRGFLAGLIYLMSLVGIIIMYSIGPWIPIHASAIVGSFFLLIQLVVFPFMPESPYHLIYIDKEKEAKKALERLRASEDVSEELKQIKEAVERQKSESGSRPQDLFMIKSNRKAACIMLLLNFTKHFSGATILVMNLHSILTEAESNLISPDFSAILFPVLMLISASLAACLVDQYGRIVLMTWSGIITAVTLLTIAVYLHFKYLGFDTHPYNWVPLVAVMVNGAGLKFGIGIVPVVLAAELFPAKVKGVGIAFSDIVYISSSIVTIYLFQWMNLVFGMHVSFYVFGLLCTLCTIIITLYVPETKGRTLEEIQMILKNIDLGVKNQDTKV